MNTLFTILATLLITVTAWAQSPEKMSYQAIVRNAVNEPIVDSQVGMRISILQSTVDGAAVYVETQTPTTNDNGLVTIEIGDGEVVSGDFSTIDWANGPYFIKTETDPAGSTDYTITGTSQLLSVPYALYSEKTKAISISGLTDASTDGVELNDILIYNGSSFVPASFIFYYADNDGDGYGDAQNSIYSPIQPPAYVENMDDCNDNVTNIFGATDLCDGVDINCDGTDGEDESMIGMPCDGPDTDLCQGGSYYCDNGSLTCIGDTINYIEICNGIDDDCDGEIDEGCE